MLYDNLKKKLKNDSSYKNIEKDVSIEQAIYVIIYGKPYNTTLGYIYFYAFIEICQYLGRDVPYRQELKLGSETDLFNKYLKQDFDINLIIEDFLFIDGGIDFLNLPNVEDWPVVGILQKERIEELYNILKAIELDQGLIDDLWDSDEDEDKACAYEAI